VRAERQEPRTEPSVRGSHCHRGLLSGHPGHTLVPGPAAGYSPEGIGRTSPDTFFYATEGADVYKVHVPTKKVVRLTHDGGQRAPGTHDATYRRNEDSMVLLMESFGKQPSERDVIYNTAPCPVPGGKVVFTSNRHGFVPRGGSRR
jgi:hypothetical protein